ncbi:MAG: hypothetical protein ABW007_23270 [Chitinophagaceae bacterium]
MCKTVEITAEVGKSLKVGKVSEVEGFLRTVESNAAYAATRSERGEIQYLSTAVSAATVAYRRRVVYKVYRIKRGLTSRKNTS